MKFYINYRKLNQITKKNRYFIFLINKVFVQIQKYKYFIKLNIIVVFNKFRIYFDNKNFTTFIIFLRVYKYRIFLFELINNSTNYQQYINNIFFDYLNNFC